MTTAPTSSPWGKAETTHDVAPGIIFISTASHGGYWLSDDRLAAIPNNWRLARIHPSSDSPWFEEDCDWALVALTFPDLFPAEAAAPARQTFDTTHAPKIAAFKWTKDFRVTITERLTHTVTVTANDWEAAEDAALKMFPARDRETFDTTADQLTVDAEEA